MELKKNRRGAVIKAAFLLAFVITAVVLVRFTPLKDYLRVDR